MLLAWDRQEIARREAGVWRDCAKFPHGPFWAVDPRLADIFFHGSDEAADRKSPASVTERL
jgi:hypothetical protein